MNIGSQEKEITETVSQNYQKILPSDIIDQPKVFSQKLNYKPKQIILLWLAKLIPTTLPNIKFMVKQNTDCYLQANSNQLLVQYVQKIHQYFQQYTGVRVKLQKNIFIQDIEIGLQQSLKASVFRPQTVEWAIIRLFTDYCYHPVHSVGLDFLKTDNEQTVIVVLALKKSIDVVIKKIDQIVNMVQEKSKLILLIKTPLAKKTQIPQNKQDIPRNNKVEQKKWEDNRYVQQQTPWKKEVKRQEYKEDHQQWKRSSNRQTNRQTNRDPQNNRQWKRADKNTNYQDNKVKYKTKQSNQLNENNNRSKFVHKNPQKWQNYQLAYKIYTDGLQAPKLSQQNQISLLNNRATLSFHHTKFEQCLKDCETVLKIDPNSKKATYYKLKALQKLKRKEQSLVVIKNTEDQGLRSILQKFIMLDQSDEKPLRIQDPYYNYINYNNSQLKSTYQYFFDPNKVNNIQYFPYCPPSNRPQLYALMFYHWSALNPWSQIIGVFNETQTPKSSLNKLHNTNHKQFQFVNLNAMFSGSFTNPNNQWQNLNLQIYTIIPCISDLKNTQNSEVFSAEVNICFPSKVERVAWAHFPSSIQKQIRENTNIRIKRIQNKDNGLQISKVIAPQKYNQTLVQSKIQLQINNIYPIQ